MPQTIGIVGLGYVGLPLAAAFGARYRTIGFDRDARKVEAYRRHVDPTGELPTERLSNARQLALTTDPAALAEADVIVVAVPTPVDEARQPDFVPLRSSCVAIGPHLKAGAIVVFESTVYPGATEEVCVPELERASGKRWKSHFFVGYSPERINPGDREHTLERIVKVVAGDGPETLERVAALYASVIPAGVHRAPSIAVAEAAKVLENTQRDLNIALMNELAMICHGMGIHTGDVLKAAATKWNFLNFRPGLVGGHCVGVDPYYLTHKAEMLGLHPQVILAGRRINDGMARYVAEQAVKCLVASGRPVNGAHVTVLGLAFKENCPDLRNSKVAELIEELRAFGAVVTVHDPRVDGDAARAEYGIDLLPWDALGKADALVLAVAHREFVSLPLEDLAAKVDTGGCVIDVKSVLDRASVEALGLRLWQL